MNAYAKPSRPLRISILGTRGVPARHGGFETFAERLALHLVARGWRVRVACQSDPPGVDAWRGITRVKFGAGMANPLGTVLFDARSVFRAVFWRDPVLVLGYNTAVFWLLLRLAGIKVVANMDGIEWARSKWSGPVRLWMRANERMGIWFANHLVADHPEIARRLKRLARSKPLTMIPYGADRVTKADAALIEPFGLRRAGLHSWTHGGRHKPGLRGGAGGRVPDSGP